jgi:NAD-dependent SIR2 family protein deacetylase
MRIVIFLGAGASAAEGAPIQRDLFASYFRESSSLNTHSVANDVARFFRVVFGLDVRGSGVSRTFPTFEEVLGLIDLATTRREGLKGIPLESETEGELTLGAARRSVVLVMADAIRQRVPEVSTVHARLIGNLSEAGRLRRVTFFSTNYDTLIDSALYDFVSRDDVSIEPKVDYGFAGLLPVIGGGSSDRASVPLLKLHGSINWLHCPVCTDLVVTYGPDIVMRLLQDPETAKCTRCDTVREPVIVPPTFYKDMSNAYLNVVWNRAARALREAAVIVFCGYSLPEADMHIKYLVKGGQLNRQLTYDSLKVVIVNRHEGKSGEEVSEEYERYQRFFGADAVTDSGMSFEQFASDPKRVLRELIVDS